MQYSNFTLSIGFPNDNEVVKYTYFVSKKD